MSYTITVTLAWWWIPTAITVAGLVYAWWPRAGIFEGVAPAFAALLVIAIAWAVAGALK